MTRSDRIDVCVLIFAMAVAPRLASSATEVAIAGVVSIAVMAMYVFGRKAP